MNDVAIFTADGERRVGVLRGGVSVTNAHDTADILRLVFREFAAEPGCRGDFLRIVQEAMPATLRVDGRFITMRVTSYDCRQVDSCDAAENGIIRGRIEFVGAVAAVRPVSPPPPLDLRIARYRFDDETAIGIERLRLARERMLAANTKLAPSLSVRARNTLYAVGVWSAAELKRALKKTPNLLRYVNNCGQRTEHELLAWSRAAATRHACTHCDGKGYTLAPAGAK